MDTQTWLGAEHNTVHPVPGGGQVAQRRRCHQLLCGPRSSPLAGVYKEIVFPESIPLSVGSFSPDASTQGTQMVLAIRHSRVM
jgi:hypothetical protein